MSSFSLALPLLAETKNLVDSIYRLPILLGAVALSIAIAYQWAKSMRMPDQFWKLALVLASMTWGVVGMAVYWPPKLGIDLSGGVILVYEIDQQKIDLPEIQQRLEKRLAEEQITDATVRTEPNENLVMVEVPAGNKSELDKIRPLVAGLSTNKFSMDAANSKGPAADRTVTYQAKPSKNDVKMEPMITAISRRVNPNGTKEITIRPYGSSQMEIIIPEVDKNEVERIKQNISTAGNLEFRIAASPVKDNDIIEEADKTRGDRVEMEVPSGSDDKKTVTREVARWVTLDERELTRDPSEIKGKADEKGKVTLDGLKYRYASLHLRSKGTDDKGNVIAQALLLTDRDQDSVTSQIEGGLLSNAGTGYGDKVNSLAVHFSFKPKAASRFYALTSANLPDKNLPDNSVFKFRNLCIVLDGKLMSHPTVNSAISDSGQISGNFSQADVDWLVNVLNAGSLPASLNKTPISQQQISAQLGADTVKKGALAMAVSVIAILIFMIAYYRLAGMIACWAMLVNLALTVYLMIIMQAAFTLPGLAGLVLGVAMCVDANVLIYERIREERERGAGLRMAIRNGFHRSTATIVDAHVTTLITAVILYWVGTEQIRGFAVTLIIGLLLNMYTALFCSHVFFDVGERRNWFSDLKMHHLFGQTTIDFMKLQRICIPVSVLLIVAGIAGAWIRGKELLDIDFNGGSSVQVVFKKDRPTAIGKVRSVAEKVLANVSVSSVQIENEPTERHYKIDSAETNIETVRKKLASPEAFGEDLQHYEMSYDSIKPVVATSKPAGKPSSEKPAEEKPKADAKQSQIRDGFPVSTRVAMNLSSPLQALAYDDKDGAKKDDVKKDDVKKDDVKADDPKKAATKSDDAPTDSAADKPVDVKPSDKSAAGDATTAQQPTEKSSEKKAENANDLEARPPVDKTAKPPVAPVTPDSKLSDEDREFDGGSEVNLKFPEEINYETLKDLLDSTLATTAGGTLPGYRLSNPAYEFGSKKTYSDWHLRTSLSPEKTGEMLESLKGELNARPVFLSATAIGGKVAGDTEKQAILAVLVSMACIVIYIWIRFQNVVFGLGAVVALIHDVIIPVGIMAWCYYLSRIPLFEHYLGIQPFQISLPVMAAILTLMGYSLNDTIVVFDRIREVRGKSPDITAETVNVSINQTLSRTVLTSFTVFLVVLILYIWGGEGVHAFAFAMLIGVVTGTYSSIYIAAPILVGLFKPEATPAQRRATQSSREVKPKLT